MIPTLHEKDSTTFTTLGLGALPSWIEGSVEVVEERNGEFYLQGDLPVGGLHVDQLAIDRIILAAPAPGKPAQPFRIRRLTKATEEETVSVLAQHISYELTETIVLTYSDNANLPTYATAQAALTALVSRTYPDQSTRFTFTSDIVPASATAFGIKGDPVSLRAALGGVEGSMIDTFGGELEWDHWTVRLLASRGTNTGKVIRYGVNLESLAFETDVSGLITGYIGYYRTVGGYVIRGDVVLASNASDFAYTRIEAVDFTEDFADSEYLPTTAQITALTQSYADSQGLHTLGTSITIEAVPEELQSVYLCDTVAVVHPGYGFAQTAKIIKTVFDPIKERYKEITIGKTQADITSTIASLMQGTEKAREAAEAAVVSVNGKTGKVELDNVELPPVYAATEGEIAAVAESYYINRFFTGTTNFRFDYQTSTDRATYGGDATYRTERFRLGMIDCSALAGLIIRGLDYDHSPYGLAYAAGGTMYQRIGSDNDGSVLIAPKPGSSTLPDFDPDSVRCNPAARWAINPRDFWCLGNYKTGHDEGDDDEDGSIPSTVPAQGRPQSAANLAQLLLTMGYVVPIDGGFSQIRKGDVLFWAGKIEEGEHAGEYRQPTRFLRIHHVAVCSEIIDGKHYYIDSVGDGDPIRKACLETDSPKAEYLILVIRLRQGKAWPRLRILSPPEDVTVAAGAVQRFNCIAAGSNVRYRWQYSDDGGATWNDSTLPHSSTVYPTISAGMDGRLYHCLCTDMHGRTATSRGALITIGSSPGQTVTPITNAEIDAICT